jgi:hypothetical protein
LGWRLKGPCLSGLVGTNPLVGLSDNSVKTRGGPAGDSRQSSAVDASRTPTRHAGAVVPAVEEVTEAVSAVVVEMSGAWNWVPVVLFAAAAVPAHASAAAAAESAPHRKLIRFQSTAAPP